MSTLLGIAEAINTFDKKGDRLTYSAEGDTTGIVMLTDDEAALVSKGINTDNWLAVEQQRVLWLFKDRFRRPYD